VRVVSNRGNTSRRKTLSGSFIRALPYQIGLVTGWDEGAGVETDAHPGGAGDVVQAEFATMAVVVLGRGWAAKCHPFGTF
jgi:hypothetical protein